MATPDANRDRALDLAVSQIEKQFGKGAIMKLGDNAAAPDVPVVSTGSLGLDVALGVGGVPRGRVIEIFGPESSGKTTLALHTVAQAQKLGGVAALVPRAEIEGEMGEPQMGLQARLMSQALRKLTGTISRSQTIMVFINQIRIKIGVMFGNPETTTGGNALKFYASVRLDIRRVGSIKQGDAVVGSRTRVRVVKNKVAPPFKEAEFDILYGVGISREGELIDLGTDRGIVEKSGAWYSYGGDRIGQGRENAKDFLREHRDLAAQIDQRVREQLAVTPAAANAEAKKAGKAS